MKHLRRGLLAITAVPFLFAALPASAQDSSIWVQCPDTTDLHGTIPDGETRAEGIVCRHLSGGDGMVTMADGEEMYIFSFADIPLPGEEYKISPTQTATAPTDDYPGFAMEYGTLAATAPAPTIVVNEDDELFLTLTNVGMAMRPDLFDPHTVHWHGFPNASAVFDGVPDASISINMGASLTYYYLAKDAGTYFYHCHVEATEHMQMGMMGNLYVHPRQNKVGVGENLFTAFATNAANVDNGGTVPVPVLAPDNLNPTRAAGVNYAYNDGDGTTAYDVEYPIQIGSFDPEYHAASFNVQPLPFRDMRDTYFLLNGRGYPDTVNPGVIKTPDPLDLVDKPSQQVSSLITATAGQKILLRISNVNVTQFNTLGISGPPMQVVGLDARLLRDDDGRNMYYDTNSLTLGGGQSADVIIDTTGLGGRTFFLYSTNLDYLANDAENFGGMMTEIHIN